MWTDELIAALQAADPSGEKRVQIYLDAEEAYYVITEVNPFDPGGVMLSAQLMCLMCAENGAESGDSWDGLCPSCADRVSTYMDTHGVDRDTAFEAIAELN